MNNKEKIIENVEKKRKEEFDSILEKIKKMSDAIKLHSNVKEAVLKKEVDNNYLKYIDNSLEDKLFNDAKFDKIKSKVLLEIVCPKLVAIENFEIQKLDIIDIGNHFEELENLAKFLSNFKCVKRVELLPFHKMGEYKWKELGMDYKLYSTKEPTNAEMEKAKKIFKKYNLIK